MQNVRGELGDNDKYEDNRTIFKRSRLMSVLSTLATGRFPVYLAVGAIVAVFVWYISGLAVLPAVVAPYP